MKILALLLGGLLLGPVQPDSGTVGSTLVVTGESFGTRGKAWLECHAEGKTRKIKLKVPRSEWTPTRITANLRKSRYGGLCDLVVQPKGQDTQVFPDAYRIDPPALTDAPHGGGPRDEVELTGLRFGTKKGKVWLEWTEGSRSRSAKCKVLSWEEGRITCLLPKKLPARTTCDVVVANSVGSSRIESCFAGNDPGAPRVEIHFPPAKCLADSDSLTVTGTAFDPDGVRSVVVNGVPASGTDGYSTWRVLVPLGPGRNRIVVEAEDGAGNRAPEAAVADVRNEGPPFAQPGPIAVGAGDAWVAEYGSRIYRVDPDTGQRNVLVDQHGLYFTAMAAAHDGGRLFCLHQHYDWIEGVWTTLYALLSVDTASGAIQTVSDESRGSGPRLVDCWGIALDADRNRAVVLGRETRTLYTVDIATGNRGVLSDANTGAGPQFDAPKDLVIDDGSALVVDSGLDAIVAVDLTTGDREILSGAGVGGGTGFFKPISLAIHEEQAIVLDSGRGVFRVDLQTGDRTVLSGEDYDSPLSFHEPHRIVLAATADRVLVTDSMLQAVIAVGLTTGERTAFSGSATGDGPALLWPNAVDVDPSGEVAVVVTSPEIQFENGIQTLDPRTGDRKSLVYRGNGHDVAVHPNRKLAYVLDEDGLNRVDLNKGNMRVISGDGVGSGPPFGNPRDLTLDPDRSRAFVADSGLGAIVAIDLSSGNRRIVSDESTGSGPSFNVPLGVSWDAAGNRILVADRSSVIAVDPDSGDRTILAAESAFVGLNQAEPVEVVADGGGALVIASWALLQVGSGGSVSVVTDFYEGPYRGPVTWGIGGVGYDRNRKVLYVASTGIKSIMAVERVSGDRVILAK
jgi:DNA-binding beta-propeller fold protein YncE